MSLTYGSMCSGYGGLEQGVQSVLGGETLWHVEFDTAPSKILEHRYPGVPNYGDLTTTDWHKVPRVDVVTAGFPCQPFSHAGKRKGANDERHLWPYIAKAVAILRPQLVVLENVRGLLSSQGDPDPEWVANLADDAARWDRVIHHVIDPKIRKARSRAQFERITRLEADRIRLSEQRRAAMDTVRRARARLVRAIGVVARDLAHLGYDLRWYGLRAADVGGAHGRFRVFLFATPADAGGLGGVEAVEHHGRGAQAVNGSGVPHEPDRDPLRLGPVGVPGQLTLLPTPAVNDMGAAYTPETWDAWTERMKSEHGNGNGHGKSLSIEAQRLLPTPSVADGMGGHLSRPGARSDELLLPGVAKDLAGRLLPTPRARDHIHEGYEAGLRRATPQLGTVAVAGVQGDQDWREYEAAIRRHEHALGRPAPSPTEPGAKGQPRLSPKFVEWLMMLPAGWVTDVPGISRNDQLKALGNGVVPAQAAAATRAFLHDTARERAA